MKKFRKFLIRGIMLLLALFFTGYLAIAIFVSVNKKDIIRNITTLIEHEINGEVDIQDISLSVLPSVSVQLNEVQIKDTLFDTYRIPFFEAKRIRMTSTLGGLLKKKFIVKGLTIENGQFHVFTDTTGYTNGYLYKFRELNADPDKKRQDIIHKLQIKNVGILIEDKAKNKTYDLAIDDMSVKMHEDAQYLLVSVENQLLIHKLVFSAGGREILKEQQVTGDFELQYDKMSRLLHTDSMDISIGGQPFNLNFTVDLNASAPRFQIKVNHGSLLIAGRRSGEKKSPGK